MFFSSTNIIVTQYLGICIYTLKLSQQSTCFAIFRLALIGSCTTYHYSAGVTNDSWNLQWNRDLNGWGGSISCQLGAPLLFPSCLLSKVWSNLEKKVLFGFFFCAQKFCCRVMRFKLWYFDAANVEVSWKSKQKQINSCSVTFYNNMLSLNANNCIKNWQK